MKRYSRKLYLLLALIASYYFTALWFELSYEFRGAPWPALTAGIANTPFQYRVLIPWIVSTLSNSSIAGGYCPSAAALYFWIELACVYALVLVLRRYLAFFIDERLARIFSFFLFLVLPYLYLLNRVLPLRYPSDLPAVLFFTLGLVLIYRRNWILYYPLFVIATLNRETSCFLTVACLVTAAGRERPKSIATHVAAQALLWTAIKYGLCRLYAANSGDGLYHFNVSYNLEFLADPKAYPLFLSNLGFLWVPVLVFWRRIPDRFVRRTVWLIPLFFLGMFCVGNMYELRIYGDLAPVVISAFALVLKDLFRGEKVARTREAQDKPRGRQTRKEQGR